MNPCLEKVGPRGGIDGGGVYRNHMIAWINHDGEIQLEADNYDPLGKWDPEEWTKKQARMIGPATKDVWRLMYRIGRCLARNGRCFVEDNTTGETIEILCDDRDIELTIKKGAR